MLTFVTIVHVLLCVFMIFVILLQPGKDAGMGATLGGGAATTAFGGRGAVTFLSKVTAICATLFFVTSLGLSFVGLKSSVAAGSSVAAPVATTPVAAAADAGTMGNPEPAPVEVAPAAPAPTMGTETTPVPPAAAPAPAPKAATPKAAAPKAVAPTPAPEAPSAAPTPAPESEKTPQ
jgi:preprotein translocase subunit SecG